MDLEILGISAVGLIIAVIQLAKSIGFPAKYAGILAVAVGLLLSFGYTYYAETQVFNATLTGLALGLSAAGLYSAAKNAVKK